MRIFVLDGTVPVGELGDAFEHLEWVRRLWNPHTVALDLNLRQLHATAIEKNRVLYMPDEGLAFLVEHIETNDEPGAAKDAMRVIGRSIDAIATEERIAMPPVGESHDTQISVPAETAIKHYVDENGGPSASASRAVPDLVIATDAGRGDNVSVSARYQLVGDIAREIGLAAGMGWETTFDPATGEYEFEVIPGVDRTASVFFDTNFDTLEHYSQLDSLLDTKTHAVVAGQGEGADREIVERWLGSEKTGLDRRELFIDARDVEVGETDVLEQRGDATLTALLAEARYEATVHPYGSFRYREHWDLGDLVTLRDADRGIAAPVRIVEVTSRITNSQAAPEREVALDRPFPTLKDRINGGAVRGGAVDSAIGPPYSDGVLTVPRLRIPTTDDLALASTLHGFQVGPDDGANIGIDNNEIMARNNGATSTLNLQANGGAVAVGGTLGVSGGLLTVGSLRFTGAGTSFPGSPTTDDLFYRTDLGELCQYDGTRWLGVVQTSQLVEVSGATVNSNSPYTLGLGRSIKLVGWHFNSLTLTTNNGSNFWTVRLRDTDRSAIFSGTHGSQSLAADGTEWKPHAVANSDVVSSVSQLGLLFDFFKTGAPGALLLQAQAMFRYIYT